MLSTNFFYPLTLSTVTFLLILPKKNDLRLIWPIIIRPNCFSYFFSWTKDYTYFQSLVFVNSSSLYDSICFDFSFLCGVSLMWCLFDLGWNINFEQMYIQSITLTSSTLQILRHQYSEYLVIVIFLGINILLFYAINMDVVSLFTDSSFLFLAILNLYHINILYQFK